MALVRYEPINLFSRFNNEFSRFPAGSMPRNEAERVRNWSPAVDIREEDNRYVLFADIPGVDRKDIDISLEDGVLTIRGERCMDKEQPTEGFRRRERVSGTFLRRFTLPETVNTESITATAKDGVLQVEIPKQEKPQARKIAIS